MSNGNDLATKQLATGKLTRMLATIQMNGTSTYWALPERTKLSAKSSIRPGEKSLQPFQCLSKRPRQSPGNPLELPYATNKDGNSDGKITLPVVSLIDLLST
jgi:hypothetical protein